MGLIKAGMSDDEIFYRNSSILLAYYGQLLMWNLCPKVVVQLKLLVEI